MSKHTADEVRGQEAVAFWARWDEEHRDMLDRAAADWERRKAAEFGGASRVDGILCVKVKP